MPPNKKTAKKLDEVVAPYCGNGWCLLKEILLSKHTDSRFLVQLKCLEHYKYELSEKAKTDVGWEISFTRWVETGRAKLFADFYDEELTAEQIYEKIIKMLPIE